MKYEDYLTLMAKLVNNGITSRDPRTLKCDTCQYRQPIPGDAHISCSALSLETGIQLFLKKEMLYIEFKAPGIEQPVRLPVILGDPVGIAGGWFEWPINFDPTWLRWCMLWKSKEAT